MHSGEQTHRPLQKDTGARGGVVVRGSREPLRDLNGRPEAELVTPTKGCFFGLLGSPASACKAGGVALKPPRHAPPVSHRGGSARPGLGTQKVDDKPQGAEIHGEGVLGDRSNSHLGRRKTQLSFESACKEDREEAASSQDLVLGGSQRSHITAAKAVAAWVSSSPPAGGTTSGAGPASSCGSTSGLWFAASPSEEASTGWWNGRGSLAVEKGPMPTSWSGRSSPADGASSPISIIRRKAAASFKLKLPTRNRELWRSCGGLGPVDGSPLAQSPGGPEGNLTLNDRRRSWLHPVRFVSPSTSTDPIFPTGIRKSLSGRSNETDQQWDGALDTTPYSAGMRISWREGLIGRVLEMDGMSCFYCCCLHRESHPNRGAPGAGYGALVGRHLFPRPGARKGIYEVFGPTKWLCPCSDSITDGDGVIFSSRSEWSIFCRNDLFEL